MNQYTSLVPLAAVLMTFGDAVNLKAQVSYQLVMDTASSSGGVHYALQTAGGSQVVAQRVDPTLKLYRFDPAGQLEWVKEVTGDGSFDHRTTMISDGAEGLFIASVLSDTLSDLISDDLDTLIEFLEIAHLDETGDLIWSKRLARTQHGFSPHSIQYLTLTAEAGGDLFLLIASQPEYALGLTLLQVLRLDGAGSLLWAEYVGRSSIPGQAPWLWHGYYSERSILLDASGGIYLGPVVDDHASNMHPGLIRLNPSGSLVWTKWYEYTNNTYDSRVTDMTIDHAGRIAFVGRINHSGGSFQYIPRVDTTGALVRADVYETGGAISGSGRIFLASNGDLCMVHNAVFDPDIFRVDSNAAPIASWIRTSAEIYPNVFSFAMALPDVKGNRLSMGGTFNRTDQNLGFSTNWPALEMIDLLGPDACLYVDTVYTHVPVPLSIILTHPITDIVCQAADSMFTSLFPTLATAPLPDVDLMDMCAFAVGLSESNGPSFPEGFSLDRTVILCGSPLLLTDVEPGTFSVIDVTGKIIARATVSAPLDRFVFPVSLEAGIHLLVWSAEAGTGRVAQKFLAE